MRGLAQRHSDFKTPPAPPQTPPPAWLCLGPLRDTCCRYFLCRASGRAWARGSAWRACTGRAPVRSSRLKKVVLLRQRSYSMGCLGAQMGREGDKRRGGREEENRQTNKRHRKKTWLQVRQQRRRGGRTDTAAMKAARWSP